ncbi:MAG: PilZ domain-containing protein [Desulfobulbaceae bacterium]|nr:PilZ domain-containing protein [Desulfobulbaceae bacterium]
MAADNNGSGEEQRRIMRRHLIYYLRVYDGVSSRVVGHVVDISPHGLQLIADQPVPVQAEHRLRMSFPGMEASRDELVFDAVCKWCRQDENPAFYLAGFQIRNLMPDEAVFIQGMISEFGL